MWPHCPHDLWCQRWALGTFFTFPNLVLTGTIGSGARCTIHSPCSSSSKSSWWKSSDLRSWGPRSKCSFFLSSASTGMGMGPPPPVQLGLHLDAGVLQPFLHHFLEDHVQAFVDLGDHVEGAGVEPDQVQLEQGLFVDVPPGGRGVQRLGGKGPAPHVEVVGHVLDLGSPVG